MEAAWSEHRGQLFTVLMAMYFRRKTVTYRYAHLLFFSCLVLWFGLMLAGLWPFDFWPSNRVEWLPAARGAHFEQDGQIYVQSPSRLRPCSAIEANGPGCTRERAYPLRQPMPRLAQFSACATRPKSVT